MKKLLLCLMMLAGLSVVLIVLPLSNKDGSSVNVTFDNDGVKNIVSVEVGEKVSKPIDPVKEHYNFEYWALDDIEYDFNKEVTEDITLKATYDVMNYYVSFISDGETITTKEVEYNGLVENEIISKEGYVFQYWTLNGEQFSFSTKINSNIELIAKWIAIEDIEDFYTVTFKTGYETFTQEVAAGTVVKVPDIPTHPDYTFVFWMLNDIKFDFDTIITSDIELVAKWKNIEYKVTFDCNGGNELQPLFIQKGESLGDITPVRFNYIFLYWELDGVEFDLDSPITKDIELKAIWVKEYYTITFLSNGTKIDPQSVRYNEKVIKPTNPTHPETEFLYWSYNNQEFDFNTLVTEDIILTAVWGEIEYTVLFDSDGGSNVESQTIEKGRLVQVPFKPTKSGYEFLYWELNGEQFNFGVPINSDITLKAIWEEINDDLIYYTITFNSNGGSALLSQEVVEGGLVVIPENPTRNNYEFVRWNYNNVEFNFNTRINQDIELKAVWKINTFNVSFDSNGGTNVDTQVVDYFDRAQNIIPYLEDYNFIEWQLDGVRFDFNTRITEDIELVAVWEKVIRFEVTFNSMGGTNIQNQTVEKNKTVSIPYAPIKNNYTFVCWMLGDVQYDFSTPVTSDIELVAQWVSSSIYVVTFDSNGGSFVESQKIDSNTQVLTPEAPIREGYLFVKWTLDGEDFTFGTINKNITLVAQWAYIPVIKYYEVTFVNENEIHAVITVQENTITSSINLSMTDTHRFSHWELDGEKFDFNTKITKDITLRALWNERVFHTITYNVTDDIEWGYYKPVYKVEHGYSTERVTNPTRPLYTFQKWILEDGSTFVFNSTKVISNIIVTAVWEAANLDITYSDYTKDYDGYNTNFVIEIAGKDVTSYPTGVTIKYFIDDVEIKSTNFKDAGVYVVTAKEYRNGIYHDSYTATLTINTLELTLSYAGDFEYEYTGEEVTPVMTTTATGWSAYENRYPSERGKFIYTPITNSTSIGTHQFKVTLGNGTNKSINYVLLNDVFEIKITAERQYNFLYEEVGNEIIITKFFNTIQTELILPTHINGKPVTTIAAGAFKDSKTLTTVVLSNTVTTIQAEAFSGCSKLVNVTFGTGIKVIEDKAFYKCYQLLEAVIGNSLIELGEEAFYECSQLIKVDYGNKITVISKSAFNRCYKLKEVLGGDSLTTIEYGAFYYNQNLTYLPFGNKVEVIGDWAFGNCYSFNTIIMPNSVKSIGISSFDNCNKMTSITLSNKLEVISNQAFEDCIMLASIKLPSTLITLGNSSFANCKKLTSVNIPNKVKEIGHQAFDYCYELSDVTFDSNSTVQKIHNYAFRHNKFDSITLPNTLTYIGSYAFSNITELSSITLPNGIINTSTTTNLGSNIFSGCTSLTYFKLPDGIEVIPSNMFDGCSKLTSITIPSTVKTIGSSAFAGCSSVTSVNFASSNTLTAINNYAFKGMKLVTSISIPASVTYLGSNVFENWESLKAITIPPGEVSLGNYLFVNCKSLTNITIPSTVKSIGSYMFSGCSNLVSVNILKEITTLPANMFYGCTSLKSVNLPSTITRYNDEVFRNCTSLQSFTIGENVTYIDEYAFAGCTSLQSIIIPSKVTTIRSYVFNGCAKLNIFVEAESKPSGWYSNWAYNIGSKDDPNTGHIIWDYKNTIG